MIDNQPYLSILEATMPEEHPPLGKYFIAGYDADDLKYPIVVVSKHAYGSRGYEPPDLLSHCPDRAYARHQLVQVKPSDTDMRAIWTYMLLPGQWIPFVRYDDDLGPVQGRRRVVINTDQPSAIFPTGKRSYEAHNGSSVISWEVEESWSDGTGVTGDTGNNPVYPQLEAPLFYDDVRGAVHSHSQIERVIWTVKSATIVAGGTGGTNGTQTMTGTTGTGTKFTASVTISGGIITAILSITLGGTYTMRPTNPLIEPVAGASVSGATFALVLDATQAGSFAATATLATMIRYLPFNEFLIKKITEYWTLPGPAITTSHYEEQSAIKITETRTLKLRSAITEDYAISGTSDADRILTTTEIAQTGIANTLGLEVVTVYPAAASYSAATAVQEEEFRPFLFPGYLNWTTTALKYYKQQRAIIASHLVKTWWINSTTKPTAPTVVQFLPENVTIDGYTYPNVLHDAMLAGVIPATSPTATAYATLVSGNTRTIVDASVMNAKRYRWKVMQIEIIPR